MDSQTRTSYLIHLDNLPFGLSLVAFGEKLCGVQFIGPTDFAAAGTQHPLPILQETEQQLREYFAGTRTTFNLPISLIGSTFQTTVWNALSDIPFGTVITYGELARRIHSPGASRAVGLACHENPIPIIVPCHRVVGRAHTLTGFGGGLDTKRYLLAHERCREIFVSE